MSKVKADVAEVVEGEAVVESGPTMADLMAEIQRLRGDVNKPQDVRDLEAVKASAAAAGFRVIDVPSLQKGAQPAVRVDY